MEQSTYVTYIHTVWQKRELHPWKKKINKMLKGIKKKKTVSTHKNKNHLVSQGYSYNIIFIIIIITINYISKLQLILNKIKIQLNLSIK